MEPEDNFHGAQLLAEKLMHMIDLLRAENKALGAELEHLRQFTNHRLAALEDQGKDHELRLRANTDGVTQFKQWAGLASGGSTVLSIIALVKAFFGV